ncbi:hypothetical protein ACROYT_G027409 [Oculina patagonica]
MSRTDELESLLTEARTTTIVKDEESRIALITKTNNEWVEEYQRLLIEYQQLKTSYDGIEVKYQECQKENVKIKRHMELSTEKYKREQDGWTRQKDDLNIQIENLRTELREKSSKIGDLQKTLVDSQRKADSRKEELLAKAKQVEKLELVINDLQNKTILELKQKLNKSEANLEVLQNRSSQLSEELGRAEDSHDEYEQIIEKLRQEKNELMEKLVRADYEIRMAVDARNKAEDNVSSLQDIERSLRDKISQLEADLLAEQAKMRDLENEHSRRLAATEESSYNITVVQSDLNLQSAPPEFSLGDDMGKEEKELLKMNLEELGVKVKRLEGENYDLKIKLDVASKDINKWENKYEDESRERNKITLQLENEKGIYGRLRNEYNDLKSKLAKAERITEHNKKDIIKRDKIIEDLKAKIMQLHQDIDAREDTIAKLEIKLEQLNREMERLREDTLVHQKNYEDLDSDYKVCVNEKESVQRDFDHVSIKIVELENKSRESEEEKNCLQKENAELRQKLLRMEGELNVTFRDKTVFENQVQDWSDKSTKERKVADNLRKRLAEAQDEVEQNRTELTQKNTKIDELNNKLSELKSQYDTCQTDLSGARADCGYKDEEIKQLNKEVYDKEINISKLEGQLEKATRERNNMEIELTGVLEKLHHKEPKRTGNEEEFKSVDMTYSYGQTHELESDLVSLRQRMYELECENNRLNKVEEHLQSDIKDNEDKIASLQRDLNRANTENEDWERKVFELENKINALEKEEDDLNGVCTDLRESQDELTQEVEKLQKKVETLTLERNQLKGYLSDANSKLTQSKEDHNNKSLEFSKQVKISTTLRMTAQKHEATVESLTQKCKELEEELENLRPELRTALAKNDTLEAGYKDLDSRSKIQKRKIDDLQKEVREEIDAKELLQQNIDSLSYKVNVTDISNKALTQERNDLQSQVDDLETKIRKIKPELEQCRNKLNEKDRIISRLDVDVKDKDSQLNAAKRKISTLETTVTSTRKELEALKNANEINRNHVKKLQIQLQEMGNYAQTAVANVSVVQSAPAQSFAEKGLRSTPDERNYDLEILLKKSEGREGQLREQLQFLQDRLLKAEADAKTAQEKVIEFQHNVTTVQKKLEEARKMLGKSNQERDDAKKELMESRKALTILETKGVTDANEISSLQRQLEQAHRRLEETHEKLLSIDEDHVNLRLALDVHDKEREDYNAVVGRLKGKKNDLEQRIEFLETSLESSQKTCDALREEKSKTQQELNELRRTTLADLKKNLTRMQGERDRALEDCRMAMSKLEDLENKLAEAMTKRKELESDNDGLESEIRQLKNEIETNRKTFEELENKIDVLNLQLQEYEKDKDELEGTKSRLEDEIADLHVKLAEKEDVINISSLQVSTVESTYTAAPGFVFGADQVALRDLQDGNMDLKEKLKQVEMEHNVSLEQLNNYKIKLEDAEDKNYHLESNLKDKENHLKELERKLQETADELSMMSDRYQSAERELELLKDELQDAQTKLSTVEVQHFTGIVKLRTVQKQLEAAQKDLLDKNSVVVEKQRKINEFYAILESGDKDSDRLKQVIDELREDIDVKDRENVRIQKNLRLVEDNFTKLQESVEEMESKLHDTENQREENKMKVDGLELEIEMRDRALEEAQCEVDDSRNKLKVAKKEIETFRSQLKEANVSLKAANDEKKILEGRIAELQVIIDKLRKELSTGITSQSGTSDVHLDDLRSKLAEYRAKFQDLSSQKMKLELELREKDVKISQGSDEEQDRLKDEIMNLQATLKETKKTFQKAQRDAEELQRRLVSKESEIKRLKDKIAKLEEERENLKKDYVNVEKKNSDLKVEYEKLKYEKNKEENELSLLKKKFQALQYQMNAADVPKQDQDVVSKMKYQELEASCQDALREKERAKSDAAAYRTKMARLEAELNEQKSEMDVLEDEVHRLRDSEVELKNKLQSSRDRHKEDKDKMLEWRKNNISSLEQELQRAKGLIKKLEKTNATKDQDIGDLKEDLADRDKRIAELEDELENQNIVTTRSLDAANIDNTGDSHALKRVLDEKAVAVKEAQKLKNKLWTLDHDMDILKTKEAQQEKMVAEMNNINDKLKDELRELKKGTLDQQGSVKHIKEKSELVYQVNVLKEDKEELEKDFEELRVELHEVRGENLKLTMENNELKHDLQQLEIKLHELEIGHKLVKEDNEKFRSDLLLFQSENTDLKESLNRRNDDVIQVQAVATVETVDSAPPVTFDDDLDGIKRDKDKLQIELEVAEEQVKMLQNELEDKQNKYDRIQVELSEVRRRVTEEEANNKKLKAELENLQHELDLANQNNEAQQNENRVLLHAKEHLQEETNNLHTEVKDLEIQLQSFSKKKAELERQIKKASQTPTERRSSRDLHNENEKKIRELLEKVAQLEHDIEKSGYEMSTLGEENDDLQVKINTLKDENNDLRTKLSQFELDVRRDSSRIMELEKQNQELQEMLQRNNAGGADSENDNKELVLQINALSERNNKLQKSLEQAKQDKAEMKKQLDEYTTRFDDTSRQLAVQITRFAGDQSETEKDEKIEKLQQEKLEVEKELGSLKEELDATKTNLVYIQDQNETLQLDIKTLTEDKMKLDNKLVEETNLNKVKVAEMEAEQDILRNKITDKDNLVIKYEIQVQQLREQLATSVPSDQATTTLVIDKWRKQRQHGRSTSYKEGLMNRFGGLFRSTGESKVASEQSQLGGTLSKELSHGELSKFNSAEDYVTETVMTTSMETTESEFDYATKQD